MSGAGATLVHTRTIAAAALACALAAASCKRDEPAVNVLHPFPERFVGVGLELGMSGPEPFVVRVIPGTAAEMRGVREADVLLAIDGAPVRGWSLADTVAALRGEPGTHVTLTLRRASSRASEVVGLRRGPIARSGARDGGFDGRLYRSAP